MTSRPALRTAGPAALPIGVLGLAVLTTGTAYAVWTVSGTGTVSASSGAVLPVAVTVAVSAGALYPGASLSVEPVFRNPNPFPVTVTEVTPGAVTVFGGRGCTAANSGVAFAELDGTWTVPAGTSSAPGTTTGAAVPGGVTMSRSSHTGCQDAHFHAAVTVVARSS